MADDLIEEFGTAAAALSLSGTARALRCADYAAVEALQEFNNCMAHVLRCAVDDGPVLDRWNFLLDYLRADMAYRVSERVRVLYLNIRNVLIRDEVLSEGSLAGAAVPVREVIRRALELGSAAVILVHNHPSGDPSPSNADVQITKAIVAAGKPLGIVVHDHLVVARLGCFSLRAQGLLT